MITYFSFLGISIRNFIYELQSEKSKKRTKKKRLNKILRYAKNNSKFYNNLYKDLDIENINFIDIPIVSKNQLMSNFDDWITKKDISFNEVQDFTSNLSNIGKKFKNKYYVYQTSGSTGSPITIVNNRYTHDVAIGTGIVKTWPGGLKTWYKFYKRHKFAIKSTVILPFDIFSISSFNGKEIVSHFPKKRQKNTDFVDISNNIDVIVDRLNKHQPHFIATYPTYMKMLCNYQKIGKLKIHPEMIVTIGEKLTKEIKTDIEKTFNANVFTSYACTEMPEITHQCTCGHQHLNDDWVILEPVDKNGNRVPNGVLSDKCLLTNFSNFLQPLIRYELLDRIIVRDGKDCSCGEKSPWIEVEGRTPNLLEFSKGDEKILISSIAISIAMHKIGDEIDLYQFILHKNNEIEIRLKTLDNYNKNEIYQKIEKHLKMFLNSYDIQKFKIVLSKDEPAFEKSGKFKEIYQDF